MQQEEERAHPEVLKHAIIVEPASLGLVIPELPGRHLGVAPDVVVVAPRRLGDEDLGVGQVAVLELRHQPAGTCAGQCLYCRHLLVGQHVSVVTVRQLHGDVDEWLVAANREVPARLYNVAVAGRNKHKVLGRKLWLSQILQQPLDVCAWYMDQVDTCHCACEAAHCLAHVRAR